MTNTEQYSEAQIIGTTTGLDRRGTSRFLSEATYSVHNIRTDTRQTMTGAQVAALLDGAWGVQSLGDMTIASTEAGPLQVWGER